MSKNVKLSDIDPKYHEQLGAAVKAPRTTRKAVTGQRGVRWECHTCGERFDTQAGVDRHDPTHRRIAWIL